MPGFFQTILCCDIHLSLNTAVVCSLLLLCNTPWYDCPTIYLSNLLLKKIKIEDFYSLICTVSELWHVGFLVVAGDLLFVTCGIQFSDQGLNLGPCIGGLES